MKMLFILLSIFLIACTPSNTGNEFRDLCKADGNVWMKMESIDDGVRSSEEACEGCMVEDNHICNIEKYKLKKVELGINQ